MNLKTFSCVGILALDTNHNICSLACSWHSRMLIVLSIGFCKNCALTGFGKMSSWSWIKFMIICSFIRTCSCLGLMFLQYQLLYYQWDGFLLKAQQPGLNNRQWKERMEHLQAESQNRPFTLYNCPNWIMQPSRSHCYIPYSQKEREKYKQKN